MCWIFGYIWNKSCKDFILNWLKKLEYRWYDSSWIFLTNNEKTVFNCKSIWKVSNLVSKIQEENIDFTSFNIWIAHTRWATHGWVEIKNTHPHISNNKRFTLVHNWIIENYIELKKELLKLGYTFYWDTDSEVVVNLIQHYFEENLEKTLKKIKDKIVWAYAFAIIDTNNPNEIIAIKLWSPLVIWISSNWIFLSSDSNALSDITDKYIPIDDNEMVIIYRDNYKILNSWIEIKKDSFDSFKTTLEDNKMDFKHFMLKEIFETPFIIDNILSWRIDFDKKQINSNSLNKLDIDNIKNIEIIASWSSYNAWFIWTYLFEELSNIPSQVHISTEFKYKKQFINKETLYIFISQSWETADTLECLKIVKNKWWKTFWIVNVVWSSIARICDNWLYTHCWVEIWVASTKTFIWQLLTILIISLYIWIRKNLDYSLYIHILDGLKNLKEDINNILNDSEKIKKISIKYWDFKNMFFLWKNMFYPMAIEWSLKCKEITYNHTESYSSWELKHWPLSLIDEIFPTLLLNLDPKFYEKNLSSLKEIQARKWKVLWIIPKDDKFKNEYDDFIEVSSTNVYNGLFTSWIVLQLFSYYMADYLWQDIDKPRNLAKSVTVE